MKVQKELPRPAEKGEPVALDTEFFGQTVSRLHRPHGTFACLSIAFNPREVYQVYDVADMRRALERLKDGLWVFQNAAYDIRQMRAHADIPRRPVWDTMLVERGLFGGWYERFSLADLSRRHLSKVMDKSIRDEFGDATYMTPDMEKYAARDAVTTFLVHEAQKAWVASEDMELWHYWEVDEPAMWAVLDMPPVAVDVDGWMRLANDNFLKGKEIEAQLGINVKSPQQVMKAIDLVCGVKVANTNGKDTLEPLVQQLNMGGRTKEAEFVTSILDARMYRTMIERYGERWLEQHVEEGRYVYCDYQVVGTETSRFSARSPNLQQVPARDMPVYRTLFVSKYDGGKYVIADANQQEPRIMAAMSGDRALITALESGRDMHQETADLFGLTRREGKDINLGLGYGMSPEGLASRIGISVQAAGEGIQKRNSLYPDVALWIAKQAGKGLGLGYVTTMANRRIWLNPYNQQWERNAINGPIQGTAADHIKLWLRMMHEETARLGLPFEVVLVVHDELDSDVPKEYVDQYAKLTKELGEEAGRQIVKNIHMPIEVEIGETWGGGE